MKKILTLLLSVCIILCLVACGKEAISGNEIPDVFGIQYSDAIKILEAEGFEVTAIETGVADISVKLLYPFDTVSKGTVFKIDNFILDNNGNLTKDYDVFYDGKLVSEDMTIIIYYAKEDYARETDSENSDNAASIPSNEENNTAETEKNNETEPEKGNGTETVELTPQFKSAMDRYESFMDEYVSFMKKYNANPTDPSLLMDYVTYVGKYGDFVEDFEKWNDEELNTAEAAYYIEVQTRVSKKLLEIAG